MRIDHVPTIPTMRPKLPAAERLLPYLKTIDSSRIYSNFGPLEAAFEERLAERFGLPGGTITTVANATVGLTLALTALGARPRTLCVLPAWTFVASAHAVTMAGLIPYFVDVDPETWALDPETIAGVISSAPTTVGAVMPVVPFGRPIDTAAWDRFRSRTGLPVVIDAATGFDAISPGAAPAVVSLHATKVFGIGEGGLVISNDAALVRDVRTRSNFGFAGTREAAVPAANAKLSEYHAAVGLAALDEWADVRGEWLAVARAYRGALPESNRLRFQEGFGQSWIASTCVMSVANSEAVRLADTLERAGVETRRWWGDGAHTHKATTAFPRTPLPVTEALAKSTLALPFFRDLRPREIQRVAELTREAVDALVAD
jgi:dTDP-4-amino-4,6-dideoxygalactose transaminase